MLRTPHPRPRRIAALVLCAAVTVAGASLADGAQRANAAKTPSARVQIDGSGTVQLQGSLVVFGELTGAADLVVLDEAGGGRVTIGARAVKLKKAERRKFPGASGRIYLEGKRLQVQFVEAPKLSLSVAAIGRAILTGSGNYQLNAGPLATWPGAGVFVDLTQPSTVARPATTPTPAKPPVTTTTTPLPVTTSTPTTTTTTATTTTPLAPIAGPTLVTTTKTTTATSSATRVTVAGASKTPATN
jgi:cell division septation protein DedD